MKGKTLVAFFIFLVLNFSIAYSPPSWIREGVYVKYIAYSSGERGAFIGFSNGTVLSGSNYAEFWWEVINITNNNIAYVRLHLFVPSVKMVRYQKLSVDDAKTKLEELKRKYENFNLTGFIGSCKLYKENKSEIMICDDYISITSNSWNYTIGVFKDSGIEQESIATVINRSAVVQIDLTRNIMLYNNKILGKNILFIYPTEILPNMTIMKIGNQTLKVQSFNVSKMTFYTYYGKFSPPIGVLWTTHVKIPSIGGRDLLFYDYSTGILLSGLMLFAPHWQVLGFDAAMLTDDEFQKGKITFTEKQTYGFGMVLAETNAELYTHHSLQNTSPSLLYLLAALLSIATLVIILVREKR